MSDKSKIEEIFEIKKQVDSVASEAAALINKRAKELYPHQKRSAYLFTGRVINQLFGCTFIPLYSLAEEEIKKQEKLNDN